MPEIGAAKLRTDTGTVWCHYSKTENTLKLRRISDGTIFEFDGDESDVEDWISSKACKDIVPNKSEFSISTCAGISTWAEILSYLESSGTPESQPAREQDVSAPIIVPVTRLRRYYRSMKVFENALFRGIASFYDDEPVLIEQLWNDSRRAFEKYDNPTPWREGERKPLPPASNDVTEVTNTNEFTSYLIDKGLSDTGLKFVAREINPWQTGNGMYSDKSSATNSGQGGMDLLLESLDGLPVVGEVKVKNDKNAFFALLQAMTYAVELTTKSQAKRLQVTYKGKFAGSNPDEPVVNIAIIKVNPVDDATFESVKSLVGKINKRNKCRGLGSIHLYWNKGDDWHVVS